MGEPRTCATCGDGVDDGAAADDVDGGAVACCLVCAGLACLEGWHRAPSRRRALSTTFAEETKKEAPREGA